MCSTRVEMINQYLMSCRYFTLVGGVHQYVSYRHYFLNTTLDFRRHWVHIGPVVVSKHVTYTCYTSISLQYVVNTQI